ncbi:MAG: hypothetical protein ACRD3A_09120 [Terriglobales bacterium]
MFTRIRQAYRILSSKDIGPPAHLCPDVVFVDEDAAEPNRGGKLVAGLLEALLLAIVAGWLGTRLTLLIEALRGRETASLTAVGIVAALLFGLLHQLTEHNLVKGLQLHLKFEERLAPYFGHRIDNAIRMLRG